VGGFVFGSKVGLGFNYSALCGAFAGLVDKDFSKQAFGNSDYVLLVEGSLGNHRRIKTM
jgi:hypothetical protein